MKEKQIAVFDSGLGGLSVLKELMACMPQERYLYYGDSANAPYGDRTTQQVRQLTLAAADRLYSRGIKALVVACNTATAAAITDLRERYPDIVVIGIEPALKMATDRYPSGHVGIMATQVTLREEKLDHLVERFPQVQVERISAPGLVELVEQGKADAPQTQQLLEQVLGPYRGQLDALVLGCTHYPFVKNAVRKVLGDRVELLDGSLGTARQTRRCLEARGWCRQGQGSLQLENSAPSPELLARAQALLQKEQEKNYEL